MAKQALNDSYIKRDLKHSGKRQDIADRNCRGLYLRVAPGKEGAAVKSASWIIRRMENGTTVRFSIGKWPTMSVDAARAKRTLMAGSDADSTVTVATFAEVWKVNHFPTISERTAKQWAGYARHFVAKFGDRPLVSLRRVELSGFCEKYAAERSKQSASRLFAVMRMILDLAVQRGLLDVSPIAGVHGHKITGYRHGDSKRERVLSDDEIRMIFDWQAAAPRSQAPRILCFQLLTGARIGEVLHGHRDGDRWIVPAEVSKNRKAHWFHLSPSAQALLAEGPFTIEDSTAQKWLKAKLEKMGIDNRFKPHDCRRTVVTRLQAANVPLEHRERYVNHTLQGVAGVYSRHDFEGERVEIAGTLESIMLGVIADRGEAVAALH